MEMVSVGPFAAKHPDFYELSKYGLEVLHQRLEQRCSRLW